MSKVPAPKKGPSNVSWKVENGVLVVAIDLGKDAGPSSTGKSTLVGTTHGIIDVGGDVQLSVNAFRKVAKAA